MTERDVDAIISAVGKLEGKMDQWIADSIETHRLLREENLRQWESIENQATMATKAGTILGGGKWLLNTFVAICIATISAIIGFVMRQNGV